MEYESIAAAEADGWTLVQYDIWSDTLTLKGGGRIDPPCETAQLTIKGFPVAAVKL